MTYQKRVQEIQDALFAVDQRMWKESRLARAQSARSAVVAAVGLPLLIWVGERLLALWGWLADHMDDSQPSWVVTVLFAVWVASTTFATPAAAVCVGRLASMALARNREYAFPLGLRAYLSRCLFHARGYWTVFWLARREARQYAAEMREEKGKGSARREYQEFLAAKQSEVFGSDVAGQLSLTETPSDTEGRLSAVPPHESRE